MDNKIILYGGAVVLAIAIAFGLNFLGCGGEYSPSAAIGDANKTNIQRLANLYSMYLAKNKFQGPENEEAFKSFIQGVDSSVLEPMGIDPSSIDDLFVCENDGEQFKIKYGVPGGPRGSTEPVIFQKTGSDGSRTVAFLNMTQRDVDDAEYEELLAKEPG